MGSRLLRHGRRRWLAPAVAGLAVVGLSAPPAVAATPGPWAWGSDAAGQLGDDSTLADKVYPTTISGLSGATAVAGGSSHSLAIKAATVWAWGSDAYGQVGDGGGLSVSKATPQTTGLANVIEISAGDDHSLALKSDGTVWAWGSNTRGQIGIGTVGENCEFPPIPQPQVIGGTDCDQGIPVQVKAVGGVGNLTGVAKIAAGAHHNLALKSDGKVVAWGANELGQLGNGGIADSSTPVEVALKFTVTKVAAGVHSLAIVDESNTPLVVNDDKVYGWGSNTRGQLGLVADPTPVAHSTPLLVPGLPDGTTDVTASGDGGHSLALKSGNVWAWGANFAGQLGRGTINELNDPLNQCLCQHVPEKVRTSAAGFLGGITDVTAGYFHSLAIQGNPSPTSTVYAWGNNQDGQLGNGFNASNSTARGGCDNKICSWYAAPVQDNSTAPTTPLTGVRGVGAGSYHSLGAAF